MIQYSKEIYRPSSERLPDDIVFYIAKFVGNQNNIIMRFINKHWYNVLKKHIPPKKPNVSNNLRLSEPNTYPKFISRITFRYRTNHPNKSVPTITVKNLSLLKKVRDSFAIIKIGMKPIKSPRKERYLPKASVQLAPSRKFGFPPVSPGETNI